MRAPKNIKTAELRHGVICTQVEVVERIQYLGECIEYNDLNGHNHCNENRQMQREIRQLRRYNRWLARLLREAQ